MGLPFVPTGLLALPGLNYPPMTTNDFSDHGFDTSGTGGELPSYELPSSRFGNGESFGAAGVPTYDTFQAGVNAGSLGLSGVTTAGCGPQLGFDPNAIQTAYNPAFYEPGRAGGFGAMGGDPSIAGNVMAGGSGFNTMEFNAFDQFDSGGAMVDGMANLGFC